MRIVRSQGEVETQDDENFRVDVLGSELGSLCESLVAYPIQQPLFELVGASCHTLQDPDHLALLEVTLLL